MTSKSKLVSLKLRYEMSMNVIDNILNEAVQTVENIDNAPAFRIRYKDLAATFESMTSIYVEVCTILAGEEGFNEGTERKKFECYREKYYKIQQIYEETVVCADPPRETKPVAVQQRRNIALPKAEIPKFAGKIEEFYSFRDLFNSLVGNDPNLSDTEKMYYLMGCLSDEAKTLVQHLSIIGDSYAIAWDLLTKRYDNKRALADKLLSNLLAVTNVSRNSYSLRTFLNTLLENTKALKKLDFPVEEWSYLLVFINLQKVDVVLRDRFETRVCDRIPTFEEFTEFLQMECRILETALPVLDRSAGSTRTEPQYNRGSRGNITVKPKSYQTSVNQNKCGHCGENHQVNRCYKFLALDPRKRKNIVVDKQLCFRCLQHHAIADCRSSSKCVVCASPKHSTLLHFDSKTDRSCEESRGSRSVPPPRTEESAESDTSDGSAAASNLSVPANALRAASNNTRGTVLLGTAIVQVRDKFGNFKRARALLDGGSQVSFATSELVQRLGLPRSNEDIHISGIGGEGMGRGKGVVNLVIRPSHTESPTVSTSGIVLTKITGNLPSFSLPESLRIIYQDLQLADAEFFLSRKIDILLGADILGDILTCGSIVNRERNMPYAVPTIFGYILMGPVSCAGGGRYPMQRAGATIAVADSLHTISALPTLDTILENFWRAEEVPVAKVEAPEDVECESFFRETHERNDAGRYVVRLPLKRDRPQLGDSRSVALRRYYAMERRLTSHESLRDKYVAFMREYIDLGHMTRCNLRADELALKEHYIIPHHGIFKSSDPNGKIRVVFDGSCKTTSGYSVNDCLHAGPKLYTEIVDIICQFRLHKAVFVTDIRMMFRQVLIHPDDRCLQLIFWREAPDEPLQLFQLNTNTYGLKSSPYLAIRALQQLAEDHETAYPRAARVLRSSVYMDDVVTGAGSFEDARELKRELIGLLERGGFELRKWAANMPELLSDIPVEYREVPHEFASSDGPSFVKLLGIQWDPASDHFTYKFSAPENKACTKRAVLSTIARTFDPLGWLAPVLFQAKVLMQKMWSLQTSWDDSPPTDIAREWENILHELPHICELKLKRWVLLGDESHYSLHGFSDGSELGYGAAVYLRAVDVNGVVLTSLIVGKSRVAPLKSKLTIPKMELSGAALLSRLISYVVNSFRNAINIAEIVCWSDSTIVLCWLKTPPHMLQTFEGNRVSQIINCGVPIEWRHVPTALNPADVASRGCLASEILTHELWWGPSWLAEPRDSWPGNNAPTVSADDLPSLKKQQVAVHACDVKDMSLLSRCSTLSKLQAVTTYCCRFGYNMRHPKNRLLGPVSAVERKNALIIWIKLVQHQEFCSDIELIKQNKTCSVLTRRLMPFIDCEGILRVGGRLGHSNLTYAAKHPVLLPKRSHLTELIVDHYHVAHCHAGPTALQAILQQHYWILSARQLIRSRIYKCIQCFRLRAKPDEPTMSDLPADRVTPGGTFQSVATDYAGPFSIKTSSLRSAKILKAYLCVFVCLASKAVHLEVVSDLSTEGFLSAFTRFVSRRGLPSFVRSDCGTNYVGSNRHLNEVQKFLRDKAVQDAISAEVSLRGIVWHFNPPGGPHFGGLFEASVKSAKTLLKRVVGEQILTFEELTTVFTRIEAVLNSRPLCPISSEPAEFETLTPAHLLVGRPLFAVPEYAWENINENRLSRFQLLQSITQRFWKVWQNQYLHTLQMRNKWFNKTDPPRVGDLILIKEDGMPPLQWKRGRILQLLPGKDGVVRVVVIRTPQGELTRPVVKICRLPIDT